MPAELEVVEWGQTTTKPPAVAQFPARKMPKRLKIARALSVPGRQSRPGLAKSVAMERGQERKSFPRGVRAKIGEGGCAIGPASAFSALVVILWS